MTYIPNIMSSELHEFGTGVVAGVVAIVTTCSQHKLVAIVIVVVMLLIGMLMMYLIMHSKSNFTGNLLYTGPGGSLDNQLGSCMSQRESGPYGSCGAAEPFAAKKNFNIPSQYAHVTDMPHVYSSFAAEHPSRAEYRKKHFSQFADQMNIRNQTIRSRFLDSREPDAVMYADQDEVDALQEEINSMTGDDGMDNVDASMAAAGANLDASAAAAAAAAASQAVAAVAAGQMSAAAAPAAAAQMAAPAGAVAASTAATVTQQAIVSSATPAAAAAAVVSSFAAHRAHHGGMYKSTWGEDHLMQSLHD